MGLNMQTDRGRDSAGCRSQIGKTSPLARCFWCEQLHPAEHPLSVCSACAARLSGAVN